MKGFNMMVMIGFESIMVILVMSLHSLFSQRNLKTIVSYLAKANKTKNKEIKNKVTRRK